MSNCLSVLGISATQTAPAPDEVVSFSPLMTRLIAGGLCVLVAWCIWRAARPAKLRLATAPGRPNELTPVHIVLLFIACRVVAGLLCIGLAYLMDSASPQFDAVSTLLAHLILLAGGLILASFTFPLGLHRGLGLTARRWLYDTLRGTLAYLAVLPVCMALLLLAAWLLPRSTIRPHPILEILPGLSVLWKVVAILAAVLAAPFAEEIFFRGLLQSMIRRYTRGPWPAIIICSAIFAAVHWATPWAIPALFALAVVIGYNYERTGRLYAPILIHVLFNAVMVINHLTGA